MDVVYHDIRSPGSFGSINKLRRYARKRLKDVVDYLKSQDAGDHTDEEMNSHHFYLTLPSNASMQLYQNNTAAQYKIKLPRPINLDGGDWEVALTELSIPSIFENIVSGTCYIKLTDATHSINDPTVNNYIVEPGHYNEDSLLSYLNHRVANDGILFLVENGKVELLNSGNFKVFLSSTLRNKLGFVNMLNDRFEGGRHVAENKCDINGETVQTFFIYCDILEHVVVGDVMAPLLHMVDMKRKQSHGKMHKTPHAPLYVPLQKNNSIQSKLTS